MPKMGPTPGESDLIESLRQRAERSFDPRNASGAVKLGMGDDCALLRPPRGQEIVVTTDFSLENVHFRRAWHSPESAGHRCLARGLSDLASMGARPIAAFLSLALPADLVRSQPKQTSWRDRFLTGFFSLAQRYGVPLAGGDTAQSPSCRCHGGKKPGLALADIVLIGSVPNGRALLRCGARAGDSLYVTGALGGAAAELTEMSQSTENQPRDRSQRRFPPVSSEKDREHLHPHSFPEPRLPVGAWLVKFRRATAAIDISDGLSTDLDHLCRESELGAMIDAASIPIHPLAQRSAQTGSKSGHGSDRALKLALHGGDDYELLFTAAPGARIPRRIAGVPITRIGQMRRYRAGAPRMVLVDEIHGRRREHPLAVSGWKHFS